LGDLWPGEILTDRRLLGRVLGNMIKNALEAIRPGSRVTLSCQEDDDCVVCRVHNPGVIPPDIQMQVFQRSFSTKAAQGRGIGTHSMKLLGERYLYGKVSFASRDPDGTTFWIRLPKSGPPDAT
jgi:sensor histidine kinase regulating citrate/malate metabolism